MAAVVRRRDGGDPPQERVRGGEIWGGSGSGRGLGGRLGRPGGSGGQAAHGEGEVFPFIIFFK